MIPGSGYDAVSTQYFYPDGKVVNAQDDWTINGDFGFEMIFRVNFERGCLVLSRQGLTVYPVGAPAFVPICPRTTATIGRSATSSTAWKRACPPTAARRRAPWTPSASPPAEQRSADTGSSRVNPTAL